MDALATSVSSSIRNLQEKCDFLVQQREYYINIRHHLLEFQLRSHEDSEHDDERGMVFGDIVISSNKVFLSIGDEYFVEKSCDEAVNFVEEKLNLMQDAIEQFNDKINEANETLVNIGNLSNLDLEAQDESEEFDENLPPMEIREELDADGNVIKGSVTPTSSKNLIESTKPEIEGLEFTDFEENIKGQLVHKDVKTKLRDGDQQELGGKSQTQIDMNNMYTFADLVRQMDEQDELEAENTDLDTVDYGEYDDDENGDENDEEHFSMIPGMSAQRAFMYQINKLRDGQIHEHCQDDKEVEQHVHHEAHDQDLEAKGAVPITSILKKKNTRSKKKSKSVGFAAAPEIREVESLKEENQRNTHRFPMSSFISPVESRVDYTHDNPETGSLSKEEFDSDLFAQLIGAQGPDEIHERYKAQMEHENEEESQKVKEKKKRVSRFKEERAVGNVSRMRRPEGCMASSVGKDSIMRPLVDNQGFDNEVSRDSPETTFENGVSNIIKERITCGSPISGLIRERSSAQSTFHDAVASDSTKKAPKDFNSDENEDNGVSDILESEKVETAKDATPAPDKKRASRKKSLFSKSLESLNKPRNPKNIPLKMDFSSLNDDSSDDDVFKDKEKAVKEEENLVKEDVQVHSEVGHKAFPEGILSKIKDDKISIKKPIVDYQVLGESVDDMARAYALGIYDDDIEEDPGVIVERVEDFEEYNKQVELLKDEIKEFQITNPVESQDGHNESTNADELMQDVQEHDIPGNYSEEEDGQVENDKHDDFGLDYDRLHESIAVEYSRLREVINSRSSSLLDDGNHEDDHNKELEPIDEFGNPIKTSRFRSQRSTIRK